MKANLLNSEIENNPQIVSNLKNGNIEAFEQLYRYYFRGLYAFCTGYVDNSEAEEIVQDTMLWLWENRKSLIPEMKLKTLLFTIVKNKALNKINHLKIKNKVHQDIAKKFESTFGDPDFYLGNEIFKLYEEALLKIPKDCRVAFELNRNEGLTHKEIAEKLNISKQTVNYRIGNALKILRKELKDYLPLFLFLY